MMTMPMLENVPEKPAPMTFAIPLTVFPSVNQRDSGDQAKYERNGHNREKRMDFQLADAVDHQRDGKNKYDD